MFSKILGKKKSEAEGSNKEHAELAERVSKMNLTDMRSYVKNKIPNFEVSEDGLIEVMKRLVTPDKNSSKRYIEPDDMDSKIKNGFELVMAISDSRKMTIETIELMQEFIEVYSDIILKYDTDNKQIYGSRLNDAVSKAVLNVGQMVELTQKANVLGH
jgi:hypothetical protein